jgi:hypothetical protein
VKDEKKSARITANVHHPCIFIANVR